MNLVKLQAELRGLQSKLLWLENEIEGMKSRESEEYKEIYAKITSLAKRHIIRNQTLQKAEREVKEGYIACLSYLSLIEKGISKHKLLFLTRLALGLDRSYTTEVVVEYGLKFGNKDLGESLMRLKDRKLDLILDALILANMGEERKMSLSFVADMAYLLGASKEELKVISKVAKAVLEQNFDLLNEIETKEEYIKFQGIFTHHISEEWLIANRIHCLEIGWVVELKSRIKQGSYINRGKKKKINYVTGLGSIREVELIAPVSGILYCFEHTGDFFGQKVELYITSCFDNPAEVKKWMEKKHSVSS